MAQTYSWKRFAYQEAERVNLSAKPTVTNAVGETNNPYYDTVNGLGSKDIGSIIEVTTASNGTKTATVLAAKPASMTAGKSYYYLKEIPTAQSADDYHFVGIFLKTQYDIDNLIEDALKGDWAGQFAALRSGGIK